MNIARPLMSRRHLPAVLATCAVLVGGFLVAGPQSGPQSPSDQSPPLAPPTGPRIAVEPPSFDFGKALPQKALVREFNIRNFGKQDLVIDKVSTSCGCTVADTLAKKVVKPGGRQPLRVTLTTPQGPGPVSKSVLIKSNDPEHPALEVKLQVTVVAEAP